MAGPRAQVTICAGDGRSVVIHGLRFGERDVLESADFHRKADGQRGFLAFAQQAIEACPCLRLHAAKRIAAHVVGGKRDMPIPLPEHEQEANGAGRVAAQELRVDRETGNIADQRDIALEGGACERALLHHLRGVSGDEFEAAVHIATEVDVFDITFDRGEDERAVCEILFRHGDGIKRDIAPVRIGLRHGFGDLAQRLDVDCLADEFSRGGGQRGGREA